MRGNLEVVEMLLKARKSPNESFQSDVFQSEYPGNCHIVKILEKED